MSSKGDKTKQNICDKAFHLFCERGYKDVTMQDICKETGLSRGGLYRHYESTEQIFLEIVKGFSDRQESMISEKISRQISAVTILNEILSVYAKEMTDSRNSLSLAICEFYSNPAMSQTGNSVKKQYEDAKALWLKLIGYGIERKEFKEVDAEAVFDIIVFSYQGVRMYSRLMEIKPSVPDRIIQEIKIRLIA